MTYDYEWLLANIKDAIKQCRKCLNYYVRIFGWHTHYGKRPISFSKFYKDLGVWKEAVSQTAAYSDQNEDILDQLHEWEGLYNAGLVLYARAANALYEQEIANSSEDGGAFIFTECGKFEAQVHIIERIAKQLNEEQHIGTMSKEEE